MERQMNYRFLINIMIVFTLLVGQVSIESTPKSFSLEESVDIETQILPAFDIQKFIEEDEMERINNKDPVNINIKNKRANELSECSPSHTGSYERYSHKA